MASWRRSCGAVQGHILGVIAVVVAPVPVLALVDGGLVAKAHHLVQPNGTVAIAKDVLLDGLKMGLSNLLISLIDIGLGTHCGPIEAHGVAGHLGGLLVEVIIANTAPGAMVLDLQAALVGAASSF